MKTKLNPTYQLNVTIVNSDCGTLIRAEFIDNLRGTSKVRFCNDTLSFTDDIHDAIFRDIYLPRHK